VPTSLAPDHHQRISQLAHKLWEEEGRPMGRAETHWLQAEAMVNAEAQVKKPVKKRATRSKVHKV